MARWEREVEQVKAGTLDPDTLTVAKRASAPIAEHLAAFAVALVAAGIVAAGTTTTCRTSARQVVGRVVADCGFRTLADLKHGPVGAWPTGAGPG